MAPTDRSRHESRVHALHERRSSRATILVGLSLLALAGSACDRVVDRSGGEAVDTRVGSLSVEAVLAPDPPTTGAALLLDVTDETGASVAGATVAVSYRMPAMGAMPEMRGTADVEEVAAGRYRAALDLPMAGTWTLAARIDSRLGAADLAYRMTTGRKGLVLDEARPAMAGPMSQATLPEESVDHTVPGHQHPGEEGDVAYYTCSMHPSVRRQDPGTCPICSMDLVPVTRQEVETGTILVDSERRQAIGVRTAPVERRPLSIQIRAVGRVVMDETRLADVTLKYPGWVGEVRVDEPGQRVERGQTLFTLYSPDLYAAQAELLSALESRRAAEGTGAPGRADYLVEAARRRLRLWDLTPRQIDAIVDAGQPLEHLPIVSPVAGWVVEKRVVDGAAVSAAERLYRIADLDSIWVEAELYESELPLVAVGQPVRVTLPYNPDARFEGQVAFVYPYLDPRTRTGRARIELSNAGLALRPEMYATVEVEVDLGEHLAVPAEAVLYAGPRRLVFLDLGEGRLRPQEIELGTKAGDHYAVRSGLTEGDLIVTSGNFLIGAESRLKSATEDW